MASRQGFSEEEKEERLSLVPRQGEGLGSSPSDGRQRGKMDTVMAREESRHHERWSQNTPLGQCRWWLGATRRKFGQSFQGSSRECSLPRDFALRERLHSTRCKTRAVVQEGCCIYQNRRSPGGCLGPTVGNRCEGTAGWRGSRWRARRCRLARHAPEGHDLVCQIRPGQARSSAHRVHEVEPERRCEQLSFVYVTKTECHCDPSVSEYGRPRWIGAPRASTLRICCIGSAKPLLVREPRGRH